MNKDIASGLSDDLSIVKGIPLDQESGLGAMTLPGFLREVTSRYAVREALAIHVPGSVIRWSYATLWERTVEVARALRACGVGKDSRVGVLMTNRPEWIAAVFGVGLVGGVAVPLSTFSTPPELESLLQASAISVLLFERRVAKKDFAEILYGLDPEIRVCTPGELVSTKFPFLIRIAVVDDGPEDKAGAIEGWSAFLAHGNSIAPAVIDAISAGVRPSDTGVLFFSSGTTDKPKGVLSRHRGVAIQLWRFCRIFGLEDDVRCWTPNGFFWSGNFAMALGATFAAGGSLILQATFDPVEALDLMQTERVTLPHAWPHQWAQLEAAPNWGTVGLSSFRYVDLNKPSGRHPSLVNITWTEPLWSYGQTETFTIISAYSSATPREFVGKSHGEPLPGNTIKIVDPECGAVVSRGQLGEIAAKGPTLMIGYVGVVPEDTFDDDGFFHTGDAGYIDDRGRLCWEGRLTDIIKTGGANVSPVEVDIALTHYPGVKAAKTVGVPHQTLGEMVVTCVVPHDGAIIEEAAVRDYLKARLASFKVPRRVLNVSEEELSLTGSAKIKSNTLRELAARRLVERI